MNTRTFAKLAKGMALVACCAATWTLVPGAGDARAAGAPDQARSRTSWFETCDADKDGLLSRGEYESCMADRARMKAEKRFMAMDGNKDGFVSKEERGAYAADRKKGKDGKKDRRQDRRPNRKGEDRNR